MYFTLAPSLMDTTPLVLPAERAAGAGSIKPSGVVPVVLELMSTLWVTSALVKITVKGKAWVALA